MKKKNVCDKHNLASMMFKCQGLIIIIFFFIIPSAGCTVSWSEKRVELKKTTGSGAAGGRDIIKFLYKVMV